MAIKGLSLLLGLLGLVSSLAPAEQAAQNNCTIPDTPLNRSSFPPGFIFGAAVAAYQVEGAANKYGRGPSVWDIFSHNFPEKIADRSNGDIAIDFYHRYKEDLKSMKGMNMDAFRFSISWTRIIPTGRVADGVNLKGIKFYDKLINTIIKKGLKPFATIFHWDTPQVLEKEYGGFLNGSIVNYYRDFADLCFLLYGDRVKHWITLNEPSTYTTSGYALGTHAPGRCSSWVNYPCPGAPKETCRCPAGDSATEPYIVTHHLLLSHAEAVKLYRRNYKPYQKGVIGVTLVSDWVEPASDSKADQKAAIRAVEFLLGWYMNPISYGDYPESMRKLVGNRLPDFTCEESASLMGSIDFLGLNYYTTYYAADMVPSPNKVSYVTDSHANCTPTARNGSLIGPASGASWLYVYPKGIRSLLNYTKHTYKNPAIYITENGYADLDDPSLPREEALNDICRIQYHADHLSNISKAISDDNVNVKGYFAWSSVDNYEWSSGYTVRFGLIYINHTDCLKREKKESSKWFTKFLERDGTDDGLIQSLSKDFDNSILSDQ